jgi:flagellar basal-body rod protein FlgB
MKTQNLFNHTFALLQRAMDLRSKRHSTIANNVANIDTPHYKAFEVMVEAELTRTRSGSIAPAAPLKPGHIPLKSHAGARTPVRPDAVSKVSLRQDGNTVDLDREMTKLAENHLLYNTSAQILAKKFQGLRNVIQGGKK